MDEKTTILSRVLFTMEQIDVHGKTNMNKMLGCIQELEKLKAMLEQAGSVSTDGDGN